MNRMHRGMMIAALAGSMLAGGAIGATAFGAGTGAAASSTSTTSTTTGAVFHPNENASHEAGESATREAQEDAGQFPTVP